MDLFDQILDHQPAKGDAAVPPPERAAAGAPRRGGLPDPERLLRGLNPEQARAVQHVDGPLLILAGAGSGKTRVITHRIAYLVAAHGVSPASILAITFTNKAAAEMKSRVEELVGPASAAMWIGTFHSMLARILRRHADRLGYDRNFAILDSDDQQKVVKQCLQELRLDEKTFAVRAVHAQISAAKNALQTPADFAETAGQDYRKRKIAEVYRLYQDKLRRSNSMDFDDILLESVHLFQDNPDILAEYQRKFRYILVDEYQDTNHAQYRLVQMLSAAHRNLCVVGDDDQSIYSFRGANIQNILDFEKDFRGCTVIKLEQNYRSTGNVLGAANEVIRNNAGRKSKKLWTRAEPGEKITFLRAENHYEESRFIASEISRLTAGQRCRYGEIAILYRLNALSRNLEGALRDEGIPYRIYGGLRFYDRKEIKDVLAYLRLTAFPRDDLSLERVINVPRRGIGEATMETIRQLAGRHGISQLEVCARAQEFPELVRATGRLIAFASLIERLQQALRADQLRLPEYIEWVENETGLVQDILDQQEKSRLADAVDRIENLKELLSDAVEFDQNRRAQLEQLATAAAAADESGETAGPVGPAAPDGIAASLADSLNAFLERAALYSEMDIESGQQDYVRLMTIHSAKGLEFRVVFLVGAEEGLFPGYRSMNSEADLEEERRLAYVAITRAREKLYITTARSRLVFGQTQSLMVSRFVREIPDHYLDERGGSRHGDRAAESGPGVGWGRADISGSAPASGFRSERPADATSLPAAGARASQIDNPFVTPKAAPAARPRGLDPAAIRVGDRIRHANFGEGKILRLDPVAGDAILLIEFDRVGQKRMLAQQNALEKI